MIITERLFIRKIRADDWESLKNVAIDFLKSEYAIYDRPLPTEENEIKKLTKQFADSDLFFAVFLRDLSEMIGYVCFYNNNGIYDLGYCFHSAYHGNGYAYESCLAMLNYIKENCKAEIFTAGTALNNFPSCNLLKKLGFTLVETERLSFYKGICFEGGKFIKEMRNKNEF